MILTKTRDGHTSVQLEAAWSPPLTVELPSSYCLSSPLRVSFGHSPGRRRDKESHRTLFITEVEVDGIEGHGGQGQYLLTGSQHQRHLLSIRLQPEDSRVRNVLCLSNWIFGTEYQDSLLVAYWEVRRWLNARSAMGCYRMDCHDCGRCALSRCHSSRTSIPNLALLRNGKRLASSGQADGTAP